MYSFFKNIYKILIPKSWQFKIEPFIRKMVYNLIYKGGNTICLICSAKSKKFIQFLFIIVMIKSVLIVEHYQDQEH